MVQNENGKWEWSEFDKREISKRRRKYLKENPQKHPWKRSSKFKSKPCQLLKKYLRDKNIKFIEEYQPLYPKRYFSIDVAFPNKEIGIEINGNQHYNSDGSLKKYYQERHDLIEKKGWKLYEFHYSSVYNKSIFLSIDDILNRNEVKNKFDYEFWISNKLLKEKKRKEEKIKKQQDKIKKINIIKNNLINSNIDFSKFGWVTKAAKILNITDQKVNGWIKKNMLELYLEKCFKRKASKI